MKTVYPRLGSPAKLNKLGGAFKAWTIARHLDIEADGEGSGGIDRGRLEETLYGYGVHPTTAARWIDRAVTAGVFEAWGPDYLRYRNPGKAVRLFGAQEMGRGVVVKSFNFLFEDDWYKTLYAMNDAWGRDNPRSRAYREETIGVDRRTQFNYEQNNPHMEVRPAFAEVKDLQGMSFQEKLELAARLRQCGQDNGKREGYRVSGDKLLKQRPNIYTCTSDLVLDVRKVDKRARDYALAYSPNQGARVKGNEKPQRIYYRKKSSAVKAVLQAARGIEGEILDPIIRYWHKGNKAGVNYFRMVQV